MQSFVYYKFDIAVKWSTKKIKSLFRLKDKNPHPACKIYEGICSCSANYIGETKRNVETRWNEHEILNQLNTSESFLIINSIGKYFSRHLQTRNYVILESSMIALKQPSLKEQLDFDKLILFRNGVT